MKPGTTADEKEALLLQAKVADRIAYEDHDLDLEADEFAEPSSPQRVEPKKNQLNTSLADARCAFSDRNLHSRMPLDPSHFRLKRTGV
jgi:hypothetical protein